jgi:hypothetical protein
MLYRTIRNGAPTEPELKVQTSLAPALSTMVQLTSLNLDGNALGEAGAHVSALDPHPEQRWRTSVDKPIGWHHHYSKQTEACAHARFMKPLSHLPQCRSTDRKSCCCAGLRSSWGISEDGPNHQARSMLVVTVTVGDVENDEAVT